MADPIVIACLASPDYRLHLRFSDGLSGSVYLGNLLDIGAFKAWNDDVRLFLDAQADDRCIRWPSARVRLDVDILRADLEAAGKARYQLFKKAARAEVREAPSASDQAFASFLYMLTARASDGRFVGRRALGNRRRRAP